MCIRDRPCNPDKWLDCKNEADCTYRSDKPEGIACLLYTSSIVAYFEEKLADEINAGKVIVMM